MPLSFLLDALKFVKLSSLSSSEDSSIFKFFLLHIPLILNLTLNLNLRSIHGSSPPFTCISDRRNYNQVAEKYEQGRTALLVVEAKLLYDKDSTTNQLEDIKKGNDHSKI